MTTNTRPVPNIQSAIGEAKDSKGNVIARVFLLNPWSQWFQQFVQKAPAADTPISSPYTPNARGTLIITGGTSVVFNRGTLNINLANGQNIIPMGIGDTVSWASATSAQFLGA